MSNYEKMCEEVRRVLKSGNEEERRRLRELMAPDEDRVHQMFARLYPDARTER